MGDVFALAVIELLKAKGIGVEIVEQGLDALFHVDVGERLRLVLLLRDQRGDATFQRLQPLPTPSLQQMAAALAYRTVFSIVPVFVLSLIVLRLFYGDDALSGPLHSLLSFAGLAELQLSVEGPDGGDLTAAIRPLDQRKQERRAGPAAISRGGFGVAAACPAFRIAAHRLGVPRRTRVDVGIVDGRR